MQFCNQIVTFWLEDEEKYGRLYDELESKLKNFGIKCVKENSDYFYERLSSKDFDAVLGSWELKNGLSGMLGTENVFSYQNSELLQLISTPGADINVAYGIISTDSPIIPVAFAKEAISLSPGISGAVTPSYCFPFYGFAQWKIMSLSA